MLIVSSNPRLLHGSMGWGVRVHVRVRVRVCVRVCVWGGGTWRMPPYSYFIMYLPFHQCFVGGVRGFGGMQESCHFALGVIEGQYCPRAEVVHC